MGMTDPLQAPTTQPQPGASAMMPGQGMASPVAPSQPPAQTTKITLGDLPPQLLSELAAMLSKPANTQGVTQGIVRPQRPQNSGVTIALAPPMASNPLSLGAQPASDITQPMNPLDRSNRVM